MMSDSLICFAKDFKFYFASRMVYLLLGVYIVLTYGLLFFGSDFYEDTTVNMGQFFILQPKVFMVIIPALTMRSIIDEAKDRTLEIILSQPISRLSFVFGKFLAAWCICGILLSSSFILWAILAKIVWLDNWWIFVNYISSWIMCAGLCAVSLLASAFPRNILGAFALSLCVCALVINIDLGWIADLFTSRSLLALKIAGSFNFMQQYTNMISGQINLSAVLYFCSLSLSGVWLTGTVLDYKRR